jgi:hypothetical protein
MICGASARDLPDEPARRWETMRRLRASCDMRPHGAAWLTGCRSGSIWEPEIASPWPWALAARPVDDAGPLRAQSADHSSHRGPQ